jgi:alkanesulfonate monooxygenase SsuD/methylene tetrahydromethanopterin reductase-like flavin-dependent oxidoreductase (luciferase family)
MTAVGVRLAERGGRTDEYLDAMRALWTQAQPAFHGRYADFEGVDAYPRPVQPGGPRIVIGGHSPAAYRRAVARGHGWIGNGGSPADLIGHLDGLRAAASEVDRSAHLGRLEINFMQINPVEVDAAAAWRYADLGVDRLLLYPLPLENPAEVGAFLERHADLPY